MPEIDSPQNGPEVTLDDVFDEIEKRAQKANWTVELKTPPEGGKYLILEFPNGRNKRRTIVSEKRAEQFAQVPFERFRALGDYQAINDPTESYIEASVRMAGRFASTRLTPSRIPGVEIIRAQSRQVPLFPEDAAESMDEADYNPRERFDPTRGDKWKLNIFDNSTLWSIELSECSPAGGALIDDIARRLGGSLPHTFKIFGIPAATHDEALRVLEDISGAFFFELELRYGVLYELNNHAPRRPLRSRLSRLVQQPPLLPRFRYPSEALSLYNYGRSASGMPLLQYLAYYQVLEFFFPQHYKRHQLQRLRQEIIDPRFNVTNDAHLARILTIATSGGRGSGSERDQLKATISGCTDDDNLRSFINDDAMRLEVLGDKKRVKNVPIVDMRSPSIVDQVAERVYAIRCRIVHTKGDGGDAISDFLLPGSQEAMSLSVDVELAQFIAQKAIIASGSPIGG